LDLDENKMLFQKEHFGMVLDGARSPVPSEMICEEFTCSSLPGSATFPEFPVSKALRLVLSLRTMLCPEIGLTLHTLCRFVHSP
jgi:hypothetical protein